MTNVLGGEQHVPRKERAGGPPSAGVRVGVEAGETLTPLSFPPPAPSQVPALPPPYPVPLRNRAGDITAYTLVDKEDLHQATTWRWHVGNHGYACRFSEGTTYLLHRVLLNAHPGDVVDHINGDSLDNRRSNLRITNKSGNGHNSTKVRARSGYRNVEPWGKDQWAARFRQGPRHITVGVFDTPEEAHVAATEYRATNRPMSPEARTTWPLLNAAQVWGSHFMRCFFCCIGDRYTQDRFCETGRELIVAMLDEMDGRP
jgi:hypothetical protein